MVRQRSVIHFDVLLHYIGFTELFAGLIPSNCLLSRSKRLFIGEMPMNFLQRPVFRRYI
jgi:hypothetical protein